MKNIIFSIIFVVLFSSLVFSVGEDIPLDSISGNFQDSDGNGFPDEGFLVNGDYSYEEYSDLNENRLIIYSNGTIEGNVEDLSEINQSTLTYCEYKINYRVDFGNDLGADSGWIRTQMDCKGTEEGKSISILVDDSDPRYELNSSWNVGEDWQYTIMVYPGLGNRVNQI